MSNHRSIALVGLSGTGKSSVGRLLAARRGWPLHDTDAVVVRMAGRSPAYIFAEQGEAHFRELEVAALRAALASCPGVVATGGGVVLRAENRDLLRERAYVVWLDAPTSALLARLHAHDEERPLLAGEHPAARLEALRAARSALYAAVADLRVETEGRRVEEVGEEILQAFIRHG